MENNNASLMIGGVSNNFIVMAGAVDSNSISVQRDKQPSITLN